MEEETKQPIAVINPIEWVTESFETHRRGTSWYLLVGGVAVLLLILMLYWRNWLLAGVVVMVAVVLYLSGRLKSQNMSCRIDGQGVSLGGRTFTYDQLKTFWISSYQGVIKLNLIATIRFMPVVSVMITADLVEPIRQTLSLKVPESANRGEDWIDRINRFLKI